MIAIEEVTNVGKNTETRHIHITDNLMAGIHAIERGCRVEEIPGDLDMSKADEILKLFMD